MPTFTVPYSKQCVYPDKHPTHCNIAHARLNLEAKCIRFAIRTLKANGWQTTTVFDGQETQPARTESETLDAIFAVDTSTVWVTHPTFGRSWFDVILGNGVDCVGGDYGTKLDSLFETISAHNETLER